MTTPAELISALRERLDLGRRRYGHGVRVRDGHDWARELREELLDAVVYAAAGALAAEPAPSGTPEGVPGDTEDDNEAILALVRARLDRPRASVPPGTLLDLCISVAMAAK